MELPNLMAGGDDERPPTVEDMLPERAVRAKMRGFFRPITKRGGLAAV